MGRGRTQPVLVPLAMIGIAAGMHLLTSLPDAVPPEIRQVGGLFVAIGIGLVFWAVFAQTGAGNNPEINRPTTALVTSGPYKITRNPIYLGMVLGQAGLCLALGWWVGVALAPVTLIALDIWFVRWEEATLEDQFGQTFEDYRGRVRRWL